MIVLECFLLNSRKAIKMERRSFLVRCRRTYILINYTKSLNKPGNKQTPFKMRKLFELYINCCLEKRIKQRKGQIAVVVVVLAHLLLIRGHHHCGPGSGTWQSQLVLSIGL